MKSTQVMVIAGETSGDGLAAGLVNALQPVFLRAEQQSSSSDLQPLWTGLPIRFFGAGGPKMAEAGVELVCDLAAHAVVGLGDVLRNLPTFRRLFQQLFSLALERQPDAIILVDFSGFNLRLARSIKKWVKKRKGPFHNWNPKIIYYVSPQVWASRAGRAKHLERNIDLLLSILPFEKAWYARHAPNLKVEFVGHPLVERPPETPPAQTVPRQPAPGAAPPLVLLLPGSRTGELKRHLPVMVAAVRELAKSGQFRFRMVLPDARLMELARTYTTPAPTIKLQTDGLDDLLRQASVAMASTGTVTLECAWFGLPVVALYKTSWTTYWIGKRIIQVNYLAMPNLLAHEMIYPELIQNAATPENLCRETRLLLRDPERRALIRAKLARVIQSLGPPGAGARAAQAIARLLIQNPARTS